MLITQFVLWRILPLNVATTRTAIVQKTDQMFSIITGHPAAGHLRCASRRNNHLNSDRRVQVSDLYSQCHYFRYQNLVKSWQKIQNDAK